MNPFIKQFGNPRGGIGRLLGKVMAVSNRKMHRAVLSATASGRISPTVIATMLSPPTPVISGTIPRLF